jgi:hypothetical protein
MGFSLGYRTSFPFGGRYQNRINLSIIRHRIYEYVYLGASPQLEWWIAGIMGSGIMQYWVNGKRRRDGAPVKY